ncbi:MAG: hypothetical protein Q9209_004763 [Squamulea sp. 1 TL-2023]
MSVENDSLGHSLLKTKTKEAHEHKKAKKRKRETQGSPESPLPVKKHKSKRRSHTIVNSKTQSNALTLQESSPFHQQTASLYLPIPPIAQSHPLQGICAEYLSPLILTYYSPLRGVILSFHNARLSTDAQQDLSVQDEPALAQAIDEYAAPHVWVIADFLVFRPQRGNAIEGWINLQNEGNIGMVCWNFFNATIERKRLPKDWKWIPGGLDVGGSTRKKKKLKGSERSDPMEIDQDETLTQINGVSDIEGHFEDGDGRRIPGLVHFTVKDVESSRSSGGDTGFLSIEGTMLGEVEERRLRESETSYELSRSRKDLRKERHMVNGMSGALLAEGDETAVCAPYSGAGPEPTIAQLLERVNEIIPLESGDWGLEDYAVEVRGFECLHFSEVNQVLKEDDEVCIRSLGTTDLRCRKISGRHQISSDGKHLIDGVAFGRPLLRRPDRPPIRIPPRKRRRLTYDEDDEEDFEAHSQLVVHTDPGDEESSQAGSDGSENAVIASDDDEELDAELDDIRSELDPSSVEIEEAHTDDGSLAHTVRGDSERLGAHSRRRPRKAQGLGLIASSLLMDENGKPYPETYDNPLLDMFADDESIGRAASRARIEPGEPASDIRKHRRHRSGAKGKIHKADTRRSSGASGKNVHFNEPEFDTPATVRLESSDDSEDDDFEPDDDARLEEDGSDKENATPGSQASTDVDEAAELAAKIDSSFSSGSESDADNTSSSGSSISNRTSSDSEGKHSPRTRTKHAAGDQEASSSGTSSSDITSSSSEDEQPPRSLSASKQAVIASTPKKTTATSLIDIPEHSTLSKERVPPGVGQKRTQMRNQRRRDRRKLLRLQEDGKLPLDATIADLYRSEANLGDQSSEGVNNQAVVSNQIDDAQFESKRQALLQAISSGGVEVGTNLEPDQDLIVGSYSRKTYPGSLASGKSNASIANIEKSTSSSSEKTLIDTGSASQQSSTLAIENTRDQRENPIVPDVQAFQEGLQLHGDTDLSLFPNEDIPAAAKPRLRLDMDSSRRLLFGALGHRAPKNKEDEVKLQEKLMKDAQTPKKPPPQMAEDNKEPKVTYSQPPDKNIRWEDKIELSAVECCHDGIELSTPPFPFVQRWDPQQQRGYGTRHTAFPQKSKKRKRNNKFYEASFEPLEEDAAPNQRSLHGAEASYDGTTTNGEDEPAFIRRAMSDENLKAANDQLLRETEETYGENHEKLDPFKDLPHLPEDLPTCPNLEQEACSKGTIIAFKQLDMSAETKWQPRISDYRTALIESVLDDGTLSMRMALRDQPREEKQYDPKTGERLYTKFEMPGYNEDDSNDTNGTLELAFADLIEPKLVRTAETEPVAMDIDGPSLGASHNVNRGVDQSDQKAKIHDQSSVPSDKMGQQGLDDLRDPLKGTQAMAEQVSKDIQDLIKDAGWHSSIQSHKSLQREDLDVSWVDQNHEMDDSRQKAEAPNSTQYDSPPSPHFHGFSSSSLAEQYQEVEDPVVYPSLRGASSGPYDGATDDPDRTLADTSSQADMEAMQALREDFEEELNRPAAPKEPEHHTQSASPSINATTSNDPPQEMNTSPPPADSLYSTIPDSQPPPEISTTIKPSPTSSDNDDLPDLSTVFQSFDSQCASSTQIKHEHHSSSDEDEAFISNLPFHKSKTSDSNLITTDKNKNNKPPPSSAPARTSNINTSKPFPKPKKTKPQKTGSRPNRYEPAPRSSQDWIGTQVVDLTLSSDPVDLSMAVEENVDGQGGDRDEEEDGEGRGGSSLPKGEGWVRKGKKEKMQKGRSKAVR